MIAVQRTVLKAMQLSAAKTGQDTCVVLVVQLNCFWARDPVRPPPAHHFRRPE